MNKRNLIICFLSLCFLILPAGLINGQTKGTEISRDWVDLGLPSGTLWATYNVGAGSPSDCGERFAWGETSTKSDFSWSNYQFSRDGKYFNKYVPYDRKNWWNGSFNPDSKSVLDGSDDAARQQWHGAWRIPSQKEWEELNNLCTWTLAMDRGLGYLVTGPNGMSIFLPREAGCRGEYWSSWLGYDPSIAWCISFNDERRQIECSSRYEGLYIRPVISKNNLSGTYTNYINKPAVGSTSSTNDSVSGTLNGHDYVDLGLSVKWATCNIGASKPTEAGDYFAWGEKRSKSDYTWKSYIYYLSGEYSLSKETLTLLKYKYNGSETLEQIDDAASSIWRGGWRMPTEQELTELEQKCTWKWITKDGVNGCEIIGPNGKSIFLPAVGMRNGESIFGDGRHGYYWSSTGISGHSGQSWYISFLASDIWMEGNFRYFGLPIRPVCNR